MAAEIRGLAEADAFLHGLPIAAAHELADLIGRVARDVSAAQQDAAPSETGHLRGGLTTQLLTERLRARVGLLGIKGGRGARTALGSRYYGRFVNFGRKAQTVLVTRRLKRRVKGNGRNGTKRRVIYEGASTRLRRRGPNRGTAIGSPYKMRVKPRAAREFVHLPAAQAIAVQRIADYWSRVLPAAGAAT
jgi:hypothetical protein